MAEQSGIRGTIDNTEAGDGTVEACYGDHAVMRDTYFFSSASDDHAVVRKSLQGAKATYETDVDKLNHATSGDDMLGPCGAAVGDLFRPRPQKGYVTVVFADGDTATVEGPAKDKSKMRRFAAKVNRLAAS